MNQPDPATPRNATSRRLARPAPPRCVVGEMLCEVRTWTDAEWAALAPAERPAHHRHVPGLGWVGAVPARGRARPA